MTQQQPYNEQASGEPAIICQRSRLLVHQASDWRQSAHAVCSWRPSCSGNVDFWSPRETKAGFFLGKQHLSLTVQNTIVILQLLHLSVSSYHIWLDKNQITHAYTLRFLSPLQTPDSVICDAAEGDSATGGSAYFGKLTHKRELGQSRSLLHPYHQGETFLSVANDANTMWMCGSAFPPFEVETKIQNKHGRSIETCGVKGYNLQSFHPHANSISPKILCLKEAFLCSQWSLSSQSCFQAFFWEIRQAYLYFCPWFPLWEA